LRRDKAAIDGATAGAAKRGGRSSYDPDRIGLAALALPALRHPADDVHPKTPEFTHQQRTARDQTALRDS